MKKKFVFYMYNKNNVSWKTYTVRLNRSPPFLFFLPLSSLVTWGRSGLGVVTTANGISG